MKAIHHQRYPVFHFGRGVAKFSGSQRRYLPLDGIIAVSLEQAIAASLEMRHLVLGVRVIKIERWKKWLYPQDLATLRLGELITGLVLQLQTDFSLKFTCR